MRNSCVHLASNYDCVMFCGTKFDPISICKEECHNSLWRGFCADPDSRHIARISHVLIERPIDHCVRDCECPRPPWPSSSFSSEHKLAIGDGQKPARVDRNEGPRITGQHMPRRGGKPGMYKGHERFSYAELVGHRRKQYLVVCGGSHIDRSLACDFPQTGYEFS